LSSAVEGVAQELGCAVECGPAGLEMRHVELKDVMHPLEYLELDRNAGQRREVGISPGVVEQAFVSTDLNEKWRQASQIAEKG
jgi:hypothetical protein